MPELPEVEIASRQLRGWLQGRRIVSARAERSRVIRGQTQARFAGLAGHRLTGIERFGKWMLLSFDGGEGLLSPLGLTGKWIRRRAEEPSATRCAPPSTARTARSRSLMWRKAARTSCSSTTAPESPAAIAARPSGGSCREDGAPTTARIASRVGALARPPGRGRRGLGHEPRWRCRKQLGDRLLAGSG